MKTLKIIFAMSFVIAGCSAASPSGGGGAGNSGLATLSISIPSGSVSPGAKVELKVSNGTAPYTAVVVSGGGEMTAATEYTAEASVAGTEMVSIKVSDATGAYGYVTVTVTGSQAPTQVVDPNTSAYKPTGSEDPSSVTGMCTSLAQQAAARGVSRLIIAFEGLDSFDATGTTDAYAYYAQLWNHQAASFPGPGSGGGYVVHELLDPVIEKYYSDFEFLVFAQDSITDGTLSVAEVCAKAWMSTVKSAPKLIVIGHSYGGDAANQLTNNLNADKVPVSSVVTIDARTKYYVGTLAKSPNVGVWDNFYETITPFLNGYIVNGADQNTDLSYEGLTHTAMPSSPVVFDAVTGLL